jgi:hypothetical protein
MSDIILELRTLARLIETKKASITFNELGCRPFAPGRRLRAAGVSFEDRQDLLGHTPRTIRRPSLPGLSRLRTGCANEGTAALTWSCCAALRSPIHANLPQTNGF